MTAIDLTVVLVHYRTPSLLPPAVESIRAGWSGSLEILVVDNGSSADDTGEVLRRGVSILSAGVNLGYAGALNRARALARGSTVVFMNTDVLPFPGCLERLEEVLEQGAWAAGPALYWDRERTVLLPPSEPRDDLSCLLQFLGFAGLWRRRYRRFVRGYWRATRPKRLVWLNGAMFAVKRERLRAVGPVDEGFRLYFEETDWFRRACRSGLRTVYVPTAHAQHLYARSSQREARAELWYSDSQNRYRRRWSRWLGRRAPFAGASRAADPPAMPGPSLEVPTGAGWLELSSTPGGVPAAGARVVGDSWRLPAEIVRRHQGMTLYGRWCTNKGREIGTPCAIVLAASP